MRSCYNINGHRKRTNYKFDGVLYVLHSMLTMYFNHILKSEIGLYLWAHRSCLFLFKLEVNVAASTTNLHNCNAWMWMNASNPISDVIKTIATLHCSIFN